MHLHLTPEQAQALLGLLDIAIKQVGIRAMEDDVVGLMQAVKAAVQPQPKLEEAA
jgi:hypothetical protein